MLRLAAITDPVRQDRSTAAGHRLTRGLFVIGGGLCLVLGLVGILLPLLPTTPFLLLAAACFARSSPRVHAWLLGHPWLGPPITDWQQYRAIRPGVKKRITWVLLISFSVSVVLMNFWWVRCLLLVMMIALLVFVWRTNDGVEQAK